MQFNKNSDLVIDVCKVLARSVDGSELVNMTEIYATPSKMQLTCNQTMTPAGKLFRTTVTMTYPGISDDAFDRLSSLGNDQYQVLVKVSNGKYFEVGSNKFPMDISSNYNDATGFQLRFTNQSPLAINSIPTYTDADITDENFDYNFDLNLS